VTITIQGPDGAQIDFPDNTPEGEMNAAMAKAYPVPAPQDPGILANAARALRMGLPFGNQMVAAEKTVLPQALGGSKRFDYGQNLQDVNAADARLQQEHPTLADLGQGTGAAIGALSVPSAVLGEGAQAFGLGGRAVRGGLAGSGIGAVQGAGAPGSDIRNLPQTAEGAIGGGYAGGALGAGFPLAGAAVGGVVNPLAAALRGGPGASDLAALQAAKDAAYKNVEDMGAAYSPTAIQSVTDKIAADAANEHINPKLNPKAAAIIEDLQAMSADKVKSGAPITLPELDTWRQFVNDNLSGSPEPKQARFGMMMKNNIDDLVKAAFPGDMAPMPVAQATTANPQATIRAMTPQEEAAVRPGSPRPPVPPGPAPTPMLDFLRRGGGLQDEGGDLASMGFANLKGVAPKGASKIIDKENGVPMDEGLRAATEAGYMHPDDTVSDFINKIGEHPTYSVHDEDAVAARAARDAYDYGPSESTWESGDVKPPPSAALPAIPSGPIANAQDAADAIANARDLATRQFKAKALAEALNKADFNAAKSGVGGNIENAMRQRIDTIRNKEPWTPDETAQLEQMVKGTPAQNFLRYASRANPIAHPGYGALEALGGLASGDYTLPTFAAGGGIAASGLEALMRRNAKNRLMATILAGGRTPAPIATPPTRAAMAAALAANADLQGQRSQSTPQ
jgi:hypothetical protein